jgi:ATP-dependent helicase/nuclease subunit A
MLNTMEHHDHDRTILEIARTLMEIAADAWAIVREEKERLGGLDFDDLQIKADALLDNADVRQKIRLNTRFLMIDEFQDTDELQYRIARKIIGVLGDSPESTPSMTNLFIVGDPKQSIYRFRGADVRVFAKAKRDIERFNRTLLNHQALAPAFTTPFGTEAAMNETEQAGIIGLRATFRLLPEIAAFVNVVAGSQLRSGTTEYDVEYDDIVCGIPQNISAKIPQGSVTMLLPRVVKNDEVLPISQQEEAESPHEYLPLEEKATKEISEPKLLAEYLRHSCHENSQEPIMVRSKEGTLRAATYSDVMILVRSRTGTDALLGALRRAGVPFMLSAGRGFYERQEILDIRSFLLFLQNTNDDIALAAVLRSPFFALSDTELYCIRRTKVDAVEEASSDALWQRFEVFCEQEDISDETDNKPSNNALRAHTTLKQLLPLAAQLSIPTLIRTILEQTSWRAMLAADERFEQMEANLEKLLLIARKYENKGFRNLYDFAEELRRLALYAFSEGEADTETGKNAVRIMTIHGAKGLEAPIVVLYNTNAEASAGERGVSLSFDNQLGMSFKMLRSREDGTLEHFKTPLHYIASKQDEIAEEAELKRLLYVALTRAKDHLLISGKCEQKKDGTMGTPKGFLRMIIESLGAEALNLLNEPYIPFHPHQLSLLKGEDITEQSCTFTIPIIRALEQFSMASNHEARVDELLSEHHEQPQTAPQLFTTSVPPLLLGTLETSIEGDVYSASQLQLFRRDPDEYERLYRLGLPVADEEGYIIGPASSTEDDADAVLGTMAGTCIHAILEHLPLWMNAEGNVLGAEFQRVVERVLPERVSLLSPDVLARIQRETQAIAASPLLKRFASEVNAAKFEVPIQMPIDQDFLIGSIDALVQMPNGDLEIWDWKTNRAKTSRDLDAHLQHYRLQLEIYAFVVAHVRPEQQIFRTRLLFSRLATSSAKDEEWTRVLEFTRLDIQAIESKIRSTIAKIRARSYGLEMA